MRMTSVATLLVLVAITAFAGALVAHLLTTTRAEEVHAADKADGNIRIALVRLEEVARRTKIFKQRKIDWEAAREEVRRQDEKYASEIEERRLELASEMAGKNNADRVTMLRVEIQALEEARKASQETRGRYLEDLLAQFQKEVLQHAMEKAERYVDMHNFDMLVQDYPVETADADFFSANAYTQTILSKPVLYVPGMATNKNAYVVDITDDV
ncbi:MAG: hypothetical protein H6839_11130 [Planctomycetes bacterium]|nr:hypothetical protein [Planctomycetota bacterium]